MIPKLEFIHAMPKGGYLYDVPTEGEEVQVWPLTVTLDSETSKEPASYSDKFLMSHLVIYLLRMFGYSNTVKRPASFGDTLCRLPRVSLKAGRSVPSKAGAVSKIIKGGCIQLRTRREGVLKSKNLADII